MDSRVSVQHHDFSVADEYTALAQGSGAGAIVTFVGKVRDMNLGDDVVGLHLEHYPSMTEKALLTICDEAQSRWPLQKVRVIHRIGDMDAGEQIVFVGVTSAHRNASFEACEFIMDTLKTRAPFWKKERTTESTRWVESRDSDHQAAQRW
ncbi:molybdopterin synthase catalytic subunit MoaE [Vibrio cincinnatiensis]|uniref:molybdopterin synthase catalytic subunit MoaE n=1 Tax=Vibrio cincinnatiensis TaxID=675 RepID=UPI001EDD8B74|nr:molybdopterin synthase catalytic subunit MoaE [Vibrio cincinnatiensis]MCG3760482.1 molybdopterin synthase catalytic subunit MoaE [Vibrio cincinnatiensis]MCG3763790.1 molybdopterin synthase catalytic subunit MoaE [Vibrio cincinnatiensis]